MMDINYWLVDMIEKLLFIVLLSFKNQKVFFDCPFLDI